LSNDPPPDYDCPAGNNVRQMDSISGCSYLPSFKVYGITVETATEIMSQDCDIIGFTQQSAYSEATNFELTTLTTFLTGIIDYPSCVTPSLNQNVALYLRSTQTTTTGDVDECALDAVFYDRWDFCTKYVYNL